MAKAKKFIVFYLRNGRIGSVPLTKRNENEARKCMRLSLLQEDHSGTKHYEILGVKRDCKL